jgi:hypothetical protein
MSCITYVESYFLNLTLKAFFNLETLFLCVKTRQFLFCVFEEDMMQAEEGNLSSNLVEFLGGPKNFEKYQNFKNHGDRVQFVFNSYMVQTLFKDQAQTLKLSLAENDSKNTQWADSKKYFLITLVLLNKSI